MPYRMNAKGATESFSEGLIMYDTLDLSPTTKEALCVQ